MKKLLLSFLPAAGAALFLLGCAEQKPEDKPDPDAPNLKGKPSGPPPKPSIGGGGGATTGGGPAVQSQ